METNHNELLGKKINVICGCPIGRGVSFYDMTSVTIDMIFNNAIKKNINDTHVSNPSNRHEAIGTQVAIIYQSKLTKAIIYSITDTETTTGINIDKVKVKLVDSSIYPYEIELPQGYIIWNYHASEFDDLVDKCKQYYQLPENGCGGSLHIVLDDGNLHDRNVIFCIEYCKECGDAIGLEIAEQILRLSKKARKRLYRDIRR